MNIQIIKYIILLIFPLILPNMLHAKDDKHKIEGEIIFSEKGKICIYLVTENIFQIPFTGIKTLVLEPNEEDIANKKIEFIFHDVNDGTYGIRCFQDQNGDGKLNRGMFGPTEPWGMSWKDKRVIRWPGFDKISFDVTSDVKNLKIKLE